METKKQRLDYIKKMKNLKYSELIDDESIVTADNLRVTISRENDKSDYYLSLIAKKHNISEQWLLNGIGSPDDLYLKINPTKEDVINQLNKIKKKSKSEGRIIDESELVAAEQYIIPIKGQAGLKKAFFAPDQYIEGHFEKEIIYVRPNERTKYHKIEVDGNSMPGILDPGDWARCEDIPRIRWDENGVFKPNKVYCLFHRYKGPLFKRITKTLFGQITLSSDNQDKTEYPDETFDLMEFSKILIVRKKEVDL
jgi:hypothetical protein